MRRKRPPSPHANNVETESHLAKRVVSNSRAERDAERRRLLEKRFLQGSNSASAFRKNNNQNLRASMRQPIVKTDVAENDGNVLRNRKNCWLKREAS